MRIYKPVQESWRWFGFSLRGDPDCVCAIVTTSVSLPLKLAASIQFLKYWREIIRMYGWLVHILRNRLEKGS